MTLCPLAIKKSFRGFYISDDDEPVNGNNNVDLYFVLSTDPILLFGDYSFSSNA